MICDSQFVFHDCRLVNSCYIIHVVGWAKVCLRSLVYQVRRFHDLILGQLYSGSSSSAHPAIMLYEYVIAFCICPVGIVGNVLSAIVWIRRRASSSAVYLAALAINDIAFWLASLVHICYNNLVAEFVTQTLIMLEPFLVLGFSVERLYAIRRPLQVCFIFSCTY